MKFTRKTKVATVVAAGAIAVAGSGVAFAYFTGGSGTGTGSASTAAAPSTSVTPSASATGVAYDGSDTAVGITLSNAHKYSVQVASVTLSINTSDASWATASCPTSSFALTGSATGPWTVPAGDGTTAGTAPVSGYNIHFVNSAGSNQNGCVGFSVPLSINAS